MATRRQARERKNPSNSILGESLPHKEAFVAPFMEVEPVNYSLPRKDNQLSTKINTSDSGTPSVQEDTEEYIPKTKRIKNTDENEDDSGRGVTTPTAQQSVNSCMQEILEGAVELHTKWTETFRESESFEELAIARAESLLKDGYILKESLQAEKQELVGRMKAITSILEKPPQH